MYDDTIGGENKDKRRKLPPVLGYNVVLYICKNLKKTTEDNYGLYH